MVYSNRMLPNPSDIVAVIMDVGGTLVPERDYIDTLEDATTKIAKGEFPNNDLSKIEKIRKLGKGIKLYFRHNVYEAHERVNAMAEIARGLSIDVMEYISERFAKSVNLEVLNLLKMYKQSSFAILSMEEEHTLKDILKTLEENGSPIVRYIFNRFEVIEGKCGDMTSTSNLSGWDSSERLDRPERKLEGFLEIVKSYGLDPLSSEDMSRILYVTDSDLEVERDVLAHIRQYNGNVYIVPKGF